MTMKRKADSQIDNSIPRRKHRINSWSNVSSAVDSLHSVYDDSLNPSLESYENSVQHYNQGRYRSAIVSTTLDLDKLTNKRIALLDIRAAALGKEAQFDRGLRDAETIIQLAPSLPTGYLRAGELLSMRGHQQAAIEIYEKGFAAIKDEEPRKLLQEHYDAAKAQQERRIDIVAQVPFEIVSNIMKDVDTKHLLRALGISKAWQTRLSDCPSLWSTIRMDGHLGFIEADLTQLANISHHVENLELLNITNSRLCEGALIQIMRGTYERLKEIKICDCKIQNINNLLYAISRVASTLTKLDISDREDLSLIPFGTVLWMCQNLKGFRYSHKVIFPVQSLGSFGTSFQSSLTHLELCLRGFRGDCLEEILPRCPKLRFLALDGCRSSTFSLIQRCCPDLEVLVFNQLDFSWTKYPLDDNSSKRKGVRHAVVNMDDLSEFVPFLNGHRETIEALQLSLNFSDDGRGFQTLGELSNLKVLEISYTDAPAALGSLLQKAPSVQSLTLIGCDLRDPVFVRAIETSKHLKYLNIMDKCETTYEDMRQLLQSFGQQLDGQQLKYIALIDSNFMEDTLLRPLLDITSLTDITLGYLRKLTPQGIDSFCENLSRLPNLHTFSMLGLRSVSDSTLAYLHNVRTLKELTLDSLDDITPGAVQALKRATNAKIDVVYASDSEEEED